MPFSNKRNFRPRSAVGLMVFTGILLSSQAALGESAYDAEFAYTLDVMSVQRGGIEQGNAVLDNMDLMLTVDAEQAWGLQKGTAFFYFLSNNGDDVNEEKVGSVQGVDNIEADDVIKVYEAWYEQAFSRSTLRVGLYDLNSEFDSIDTAGLFINPSHGIGPDYSQSGRNGPSIFPATSFSFRYAAEIAERGYWRVVLLDGVPGDPDHTHGTHIHFKPGEGFLIAAEVGVREIDAVSHWAVGGWRYSEAINENAAGDAIASTVNQGIYTLLENNIRDDISLYLRAGVADRKINQIGSYLGGGLVLTGISARESDQAGISVAVANMSRWHIDSSDSESREITWEITYRSQITDWFAVQPDLQYVRNPNADPALDDALVIGVRFEITH